MPGTAHASSAPAHRDDGAAQHSHQLGSCVGARSSLAPLGEPEPITPPIQGDAGVPPAMPASACAVRKRKADVSSTAVTQTAKRAVSAALDARGGPKQEGAVSSGRLLLAVWAAAVASLTRGRCSPSEGAQAAAVVLFVRFKRTQRSRSEESSGEEGGCVHTSGPCSAAPCASPDLDASVGVASDFVVVSEDAAYLAASLWLATKLVDHQLGVPGARVMSIATGLVPFEQLVTARNAAMASSSLTDTPLTPSACPPEQRQRNSSVIAITNDGSCPISAACGPATKVLKACEAEIGNALGWALAAGLSVVNHDE